MSRLMFTQLLLCGFLYVRVDGKLKMLLSSPPQKKTTNKTFLSECNVDYE